MPVERLCLALWTGEVIVSDKKIGVGIIGVQPGRSWAAVAHIPALQALPGYEIVALSTTRMESAKAAGEAFGVTNCYDNHDALVNDPAVDLVVVTVKVPHHFELVNAALDAGKMVYCEWPLGNGLDEAVALADKARTLGIRCAAGMQARAAPVMAYVHDLIAQGYVGEVLSTTLVGSGMAWGPVTDNSNAYTNDKKNGATMLTIPIGHTMDALCHCLGEVTELSATIANQRKTVLNAESGETIPMTAEDQVAFSGSLEGGATVSVHYRGGMIRGTGLLWEINGTQGDLQITAMAGHAQIFDLKLSGAKGDQPTLVPMDVPAAYLWSPPELVGPAVNMAQAFIRFANDLRDGTKTCPDFDDAVVRHKMIAAIERSAANGTREKV
jgi:predicted dehydrogenase